METNRAEAILPASPRHKSRADGLTRITAKTPSGRDTTCNAPTDADVNAGRHSHVGSSKTAACWVCRRYYGPEVVIKTSFRCAVCGTPVCAEDRTAQDTSRKRTCMSEHINSTEAWMCCAGAGKPKPSMLRRRTEWYDEKYTKAKPLRHPWYTGAGAGAGKGKGKGGEGKK